MRKTARIILVFGMTVVSVVCLTADEIEAERSGWSATPNTQYHIQTDEGPERYFRFQTLNGQFRKEKRLEDGTVIGTEGWLDPLGYLRIKDYIADRNGFRILKSKMVYVGKNRPSEDAAIAVKTAPAQSGILVQPRRPPNPFRQPTIPDVSSNSIESNTAKPPYRLYSPVTRRYRLRATTSSPRRNYQSRGPIEPSRPTSIEENRSRKKEPTATNYLQPSYDIEAPYERSSDADIQAPRYESNRDLRTSDSLAVEISPETTYGLGRYNGRSSKSEGSSSSRPVATSIVEDSAKSRAYRGSTNYRSAMSRRRSWTNSDRATTRNHPGDKPGASTPAARNRRVSVGKTPEYEFPTYDGHHTTADGFQYYLKSQYHEEEKRPHEDRSVGSFGYVDPFGIRRVVYYKADGENGFVHKRNNRYVGRNGTPYDPLPLVS